MMVPVHYSLNNKQDPVTNTKNKQTNKKTDNSSIWLTSYTLLIPVLHKDHKSFHLGV